MQIIIQHILDLFLLDMTDNIPLPIIPNNNLRSVIFICWASAFVFY